MFRRALKAFSLKNTTVKSLAAFTAISCSTSCFADFYIGAGAGATNWDDGSDGTSLEALGGFQFSENLAAEIAYNDLGSFDYQYKNATYTTDLTGVNYSLVGLLPLSDTISLKAKISYLDLEIERSIDNQSIFKTQIGAVNYAVGLDVNAFDNIYFSLEYRVIPIEYEEFGVTYEEEADNVTLGIKLTF